MKLDLTKQQPVKVQENQEYLKFKAKMARIRLWVNKCKGVPGCRVVAVKKERYPNGCIGPKVPFEVLLVKSRVPSFMMIEDDYELFYKKHFDELQEYFMRALDFPVIEYKG